MESDKIINTNPDIKIYHFKANEYYPNSKLPLLLYGHACLLGKQKKKAAGILQKLFNKNNWKNSWSNGIYSFHHYHSNTHECLAVASGSARVIFGGPGEKGILLQKGDVIIIPAGLAHKCSRSSADFLCVGAYPGGKEYDINLGTKEEYGKAKRK